MNYSQEKKLASRKKTKIDPRIQDLVEGFARELTSLVEGMAEERARATLADAFSAAIGGKSSTRKQSTRRAAPTRAKRKARPARGGKRKRRSPEEIVKLQAKILSELKKSPNMTAETLNKKLGTSTKDVQGPMKALVDDGKVKAKGSTRARTYSLK